MSVDDIAQNLQQVREGIAAACRESGRDPADVLVVAAAKTQPVERITAAVAAGVDAIGHNYVQELRATHDLVPGVRWHHIGALQSNTVHHVAALADVVETLAGERAVARLARRAAALGRTLDGLIEVDFTGNRTGVPPQDVPAFVETVSNLEGLRLRGLMTLPPRSETEEGARPWFSQLRGLRDDLRADHPDMLDLSMGMSFDYRVAVQEGATMVRIGTALFGSRDPRARYAGRM
jgi:pyridoxal phosphate enzyme (YggS family)